MSLRCTQVGAQLRAACLAVRHQAAHVWTTALGAWLARQVEEATEVRPIVWDEGPPELLGFVAASERVLPDRVRPRCGRAPVVPWGMLSSCWTFPAQWLHWPTQQKHDVTWQLWQARAWLAVHWTGAQQF
jgi:hypothetical protein